MSTTGSLPSDADQPGHEPHGDTTMPTALLFGPLTPDDPPRVGDFWLDARAVVRPSGIAYLAHPVAADDRRAVLVVVLAEGAANDPGARARLAGEVNMLHIDTVVARGGADQDEGRLASRFRGTEGDPVAPDTMVTAPWVALAYDGTPAAVAECDRLLASVALVGTRPLGQVAGPDYRLSWLGRDAPAASRLWPLPWPGRPQRAGWVSLLASWLLLLLVAAIALLIAVLLFMNAPPEPPQPPVPTTPPPSSSQGSGTPPPSSSQLPSKGSASASPSKPSGSPSPSKGSGSPSPSKGSASPSPSKGSGSPTPSQGSGSPSSSTPSASASPTGGEASDHPSMESANPSGSASGPAGSTPPNRRL